MPCVPALLLCCQSRPCRCYRGLSLPPSPEPPRPCAQQSTVAACHQPCTSPSPALPLPHDWTTAMVRTRGGHRYRPRVQFSTPERDDAGTSRAADAHSPDQAAETPPTLAPAAISEEAQALEPPSRRYQTRVGPRAPSPVHPRPRRRAPPSKRARTSGPGESSRSRPEPSPPPVDQGSSPQLSPASRIRRPMFSCDPIPGNVDLRARDFHMESYYDIPALTADQRCRDSMQLIRQYSLLPFMTPRQFYYPRVVLEFYHTMTSRGVPSPLEIRFSIDSRPGVLRAADITAALSLPVVLANSTDYRRWPQPSQREMVRCLARDTTAGPILFRRQLAPQMLLVDHVLRTSLFPLQHYVKRRGAILEALYRISEGFWFSPSELIMTSLLHFEEKVHRKDLARAEAFPLLMPRLLSQVLKHLGFPEEPALSGGSVVLRSYPPSDLYICHSPSFSNSRRRQQMMLHRTHRGESILFQRWRWRGPQFQIHLLQFHLLLPQLLLTLLAHPIQHISHQSISMSVPGS